MRSPLSKHHILGALGGLVLTLACSLVFHWQTKDLVWGLWASSFCFGYSYILLRIISLSFGKGILQIFFLFFYQIYLLIFFTFHFGMFHFVHSLALNLYFPLLKLKGFPNPLHILFLALQSYWPFVASTFISRWLDLKEAVTPIHTPEEKNGMFLKPYLNVFRMHILIVALGGMSKAQFATYVNYPLLVLYFFPWGAMFFGKKDNETAPPLF